MHAYFYINTVKLLKLCPEMLRTDYGTENVLTTCVQCFLANSVNAHKYGSSHSNNRIENYWLHSKKSSFSWIIDFFKDMVFNGELEIGNTVHMEALWFVFYELIQSELDEVRAHWDSHYIRKSTFDLFFLPESFGYEHRGIQITDEDIAKVLEEDNFFATCRRSH